MDSINQRISDLSPAKRAILEQRLKEKAKRAQPLSTIQKLDRSGPLPLSFSQQRLWLVEQLDPGNLAYHRPTHFRLTGTLNIAALAQSLNEIVRRHEVLRSHFPLINGQPSVAIAPTLSLSLPVTDLSQSFKAEQADQMRQIIHQETQQPFDLAKGSLIRAQLVKLSDEEHLLLITLHHIIFDGWSAGVLKQELIALYTAFSTDRPSPLLALTLQYVDFAHWQRQQWAKVGLEKQLTYWKSQLGGKLPVLELPTDRPRSSHSSAQGATHTLLLSQALTDRLKSLSQQANATLFMTLLAAFKVLLYRHTGQTDIIVGTPIAGRDRLETEPLIGIFMNFLALRSRLEDNPSFRSLLKQVRDTALGAHAHQFVSFDKLVEALQPERKAGQSPLFQILFQLRNLPATPNYTQHLQIQGTKFNETMVGFDLNLEAVESPEGLACHFLYRTGLFDESTISRMAGHFQVLLEAIVTTPEQPIATLPLLKEFERHQLLETWNNTQTDYPQNKCIHQLFEEQAARTPDAIAVIFKNKQLTYKNLNQQANQLAHHLKTLGVETGTLVGLGVNRSLEMMIGLLAILKAGGVYVPLDPGSPPERLAFMLEDTQVSVLLTTDEAAKNFVLGHSQAKFIYLETALATLNLNQAANLTSGSTATDLAYVMYTSGSTGQPKGVSICHRGVVRLVKGIDYAAMTPNDVFLQLAPMAFDAATLEIWGALLNGARLVLFPDSAPTPEGIGRVVLEHKVTFLWLTAGLFHLMVDYGLSDLKSIRYLLAGGDVLSVSHVQRAVEQLEHCTLINGYGPTENTTFTCCYAIPPAIKTGHSIPIGRPISNTQVYVLDSHSQPVPVGVSGELYVGGDGLAQGYFNRPVLNQQKFIDNPFSHKSGKRLYKTGDVVRYLPDSNIEFLGRLDDQVKIRGFRIELGEVEATLANHPQVRESVVIVSQDSAGNKRLVAYFTPCGLHPSSRELSHFLQKTLPDYMVPSAFVTLDSLPLTFNGKVDRRALPELDWSQRNLDNLLVAPQTPVEEQLSQIWCDLLKVEQVGIHDDFFELGGHSLILTQVISRIRNTFAVDLPLLVLFESPTIAALAAKINQREAEAISPALLPISKASISKASISKASVPRAPVSEEGHLRLSFAQQRLWFIDQLEGSSAIYNISQALRLTGSLNITALAQAINEIICRHEALRTTFQTVEGKPAQIVTPPDLQPLSVIDLQSHSEEKRSHEVKLLVREAADRPFDLKRDRLIRTSLLKLKSDSYILLITMHHIVSDGWSLGVFARELSALYHDFSQGRPLSLPPLPIQYAEFSRQQRQWLSGDVLAQQLAYWKQKLAELPPNIALPTDRPRPLRQTYDGNRQTLTLSPSLSQALKALAKKSNATPYMLLLAAFQVLLFRQTWKTDFAVGTAIANRNRQDVENLIGFFANTLVIRADLSGQPTFLELLERVKQTALEAYTYQDLPFEKLVETLNPARNLSYHPIIQVIFGLNNHLQERLELEGLQVEPLTVEHNIAKFDLGLIMNEKSQHFVAEFVYNTDLFDRETIEKFSQQFQGILNAIAASPDQTITDLARLKTSQKQFSCVLIGQGSLLIPCAEKLLTRGHLIRAIVSDDRPMRSWAIARGISYLPWAEQLTDALAQESFDYLFSIFNLNILPPALLKLPSKGAINVHDALLPRYGGLYAPSWTIFHQEAVQGLTWHWMSEGIDEGDILKQIEVPISDDETAFSLNAKCYGLILQLFPELIDDLVGDRLKPRPQDLTQRLYFNQVQRPTPGCVVDWAWTADKIAAFFRALDFGTYANSFGLPKLYVDSAFYTITAADISEQSTDVPPGTIVNIATNDSVQISTASEDIVVRSLQTLEGTPIDLLDWATQHPLQAGSCLIPLPLPLSESIKTLEAVCLRWESFWVQQLAGLDPLSLPISSFGKMSEKMSPPAKIETVMWKPAAAVQKALQQFSSVGTRQDILLTAWVAFLARINQCGKFDLGLRVSRKTNFEETDAIQAQLFSSIVPCHMVIDCSHTLDTLVSQIQVQVSRAQNHRTFHRDIVTRYPELSTLKNSSIEQQFPIVISLPETLADDVTSTSSAFEFVIDQAGDCTYCYDTNQYRTSDIKRLLQSFTAFVEQWALYPTQQLSTLSLLSASDFADLRRWQQPAVDFPQRRVYELFEAQAEQTPDEIALIDGATQQKLTYQQLNYRANQVAHHLQKLGVQSETLVGLCIERSIEMVVGMLGILKAGGAYLPLDPTYPQERLQLIVADAEPVLILTHAQCLAAVAPMAVPYLCLDRDWSAISDSPIHNLKLMSNIKNLAYVIYTSGSTGKPKGVMIEHLSLANFSMAVRQTYNLGGFTALEERRQQRILQFASISFDTAAEEIYPCLISGHTLVLRTANMISSVKQFLQTCQDWTLTVLDLPTAYWQQIVAELAVERVTLPDSLELVIIGGERVSLESVRIWQSQVGDFPRLINSYGPTETTVVATACTVSATTTLSHEVPIGRAIANVQTHVLDQYLQPLPVGITGELYIGGTGLARGYLNQPALSAECFIANPLSEEPKDRLYKTGDLVRYLPDGNLEFLGRTDRQIKIRGFRVELREVENALLQLATIQSAVVTAKEDASGSQQLTAYVVPFSTASLHSHQVKNELQGRLPNYMIPAEILFLSELPLTPNGKINHRELSLTQSAQTHAATVKVTEPRTELEQQLLKIWETCLKVQPIGIHDNFFDLGGHSLLAMKVISKIEHQLGLPFPINQLFKSPTIAGISQALVCAEEAILPPYVILLKSGKANVPPLFLVHSAGPSILFYQPLVKLLQTERPIYGIQSAFLSDSSLKIDNIEELAKQYIEQIKLVQPQEPYFIAGASLGGSIAYEIAQQLTRQGNEIGALILLDRAAPGGYSLTPAARRYQRYWKKFLQSGSSYLVTKLKSRTVFEFNQLRGKAKRIQHQIYKKLDLPTERFLKEEIHQRHLKLSQRYQPESYSGSIIVIRANQVPDSITILKEDLGWSAYVQGEVKVLQNPGGHMSMFKAPYVQTLAAQLDTLLGRALHNKDMN